MKNTFFKTSNLEIVIILLILFLGNYLYSQQMLQATIEQGTPSNSVVVNLLPSITSTEQMTNLQFTIAIPATVMPQPTPNILMGPPGAGWISGGAAITTETVNGQPHYVYTFTYLPASFLGVTTNFTAGVELQAFHVQFTGCTTNCDAEVKLVQLANGGSTFQSNFYAESYNGDITNTTMQFYSDTGGTFSNTGCYCTESYVGTANLVDLPIELTTFDVRSNDCDVTLYWETATEQDFGYYQIEASRDGRSFQSVAQQKPESPNSLETRRYKYQIPEKYEDHYFRLKAVDLDGSYEYSPVVFAEAPCEKEQYSMSLYPNPNYTSQLTVEVNSAKAMEGAQLQVLDAFGKVVQLQKVDITVGSNNIVVDTDKLASGTYYIRIIGIAQLSEPLKFVRSNF